MKIKITSDGTPFNTTVANAETGEKLEGVRSIEFRIAVDEWNQARLEIDLARIESATLDAYVGRVRDTTVGIVYEFNDGGDLQTIVLPSGARIDVPVPSSRTDSLSQQVEAAVIKVLAEHRAEMTGALLGAIVDEVSRAFTPVCHPGDHD